jgi:hypothetical protein
VTQPKKSCDPSIQIYSALADHASWMANEFPPWAAAY